MKPLSLKLRDDIFREVEKITMQIHFSRNAYINEAVDFYNKLHRRKTLRKQLHQESKVVKSHSLEILQEFERLEDPAV